MEKTFTVKLNTQFTFDFATWGLSAVEQQGGYETMRMLITHFLSEHGFDEFELHETNGNTLPQTMAELAKAEANYLLANKQNFEYN